MHARCCGCHDRSAKILCIRKALWAKCTRFCVRKYLYHPILNSRRYHSLCARKQKTLQEMDITCEIRFREQAWDVWLYVHLHKQRNIAVDFHELANQKRLINEKRNSVVLETCFRKQKFVYNHALSTHFLACNLDCICTRRVRQTSCEFTLLAF